MRCLFLILTPNVKIKHETKKRLMSHTLIDSQLCQEE